MINSVILKKVVIIARNTAIIVLEWMELVVAYLEVYLIATDVQEIKYAKII
jgi:hypothetical protein